MNYADTIRDAAEAMKQAAGNANDLRLEIEGIQRAGTAVNQAAASALPPGVSQPPPNFGTGQPGAPTVGIPQAPTRGQGGGDAGSGAAAGPSSSPSGSGGDGGASRLSVGPAMLISADGSHTSSADWVARTCKRGTRKIPNPKNSLSLLGQNSDDMVTVDGWDCSSFFGSDVFFYDPASFNALGPAARGEAGTGSGMGPRPTTYTSPPLVLGSNRTALGGLEDLNAAAGRSTPQTVPSGPRTPLGSPSSTSSASTSSNRSASLQSAPAAITLGDKAVVDAIGKVVTTLDGIRKDNSRPAVDPFKKAKVLG